MTDRRLGRAETGGRGRGASGALLVDNADWLDTLGYIPLLRDGGAHFSINRMLTFDSVRLRLDRGSQAG